MAEKRPSPKKKSPKVLEMIRSCVRPKTDDDSSDAMKASRSPDKTLSDLAQAPLQEEGGKMMLTFSRTHVKKKDDVPAESDKIMLTFPRTHVKKEDDVPEESYKMMLTFPRTHVEEEDDVSLERPIRGVCLIDCEEASSTAGHTTQAKPDLHKEEFVPIRHPTGRAREVARSILDLPPAVKREGKLAPPELSKSPMAAVPKTPTAKTPKVRSQRKPRQACLECTPNVNSPDRVCSHVTRAAARRLDFGTHTEPTEITRKPRNPVFGVKLDDDVADSGQDVPRVVVRCVAIIEQWCQQNKHYCLFVYKPTESSEDKPTKSSEDKPTKSSEDRPTKSSEDRPTKSSEDRPRKSSEDRPRKSSEDRPTKSSEDRPTKSSEDRRRKSSEDRRRKSSEDRRRKSSEEIKAIRAAFTEGKDDDLGTPTYSVRSYAEVLKQYLWELPDPVIPQAMYNQFMEFLMSGRVEGTEFRTIADLVHAMPPRHRSTLQALLRHFTRMLRWQAEDDPEETYDTLIYEVSHILIRPPWNQIREIKDYIKVYNDILIELIRAGCWGEEPPNLPIVMPSNPTPTTEKDKDDFAPKSPTDRLREAPWYWGAISNYESKVKVMSFAEGSFLVRDSSEPGNYVLVLRTADDVVLIKIICNDHGCGFVKPVEYASVVTLIHWYRNNSLTPYNQTLTTKLLYPIMTRLNESFPRDTKEQQVRTLMIINQQVSKRRALYMFLYKNYIRLTSETSLKSQAFGAYKQLINILQEQNKQQKNHPTEVERSVALYDTITEFKDSLQAEVNRHVVNVILTNGELCLLKYIALDLAKQLGESLQWLAQGYEPGYLKKFISLDESVWLVDCQRPEAESMLLNTQNGTFLIRPKPEDKHVLSVMHNGKVVHLEIIHESDFCGFPPNLIFTSVHELVNYHHYRSLAMHFPALDVCLLFPVTIDRIIATSEPKEQPQAAQPEGPETEM